MPVISKSYYLSLIDLHQKLPLFFQPWWLNEVCDNNWDIAIVEKKGEMKAIFPYKKDKKYGLNLIRNPLLTPYLGPYLIEQKDEPARQWEIEEKYIAELWLQFPKWDFFQFHTLPEFGNFQLFHKLGFTNHAKLTYYVDLQKSEEELFAQIHPRRRSYIRKAEKSIRVEIDEKPDLQLFYQWHKHAFSQKKERYPYTLPFIENIIAAAHSHEASLYLTAKDNNGTPLAMLWTPFDQEKAYHLLGAYNPAQKINGVMDLLVWNALKTLKAKGKLIYDFEGSMEPGIESFFRKFGGERKQYYNFEQSKSLIWKLKSTFLG